MTFQRGQGLRMGVSHSGVDDTNERMCAAMALQEGERYQCPDAGCGCEITVTQSAAEGDAGNQSPTCCCGHRMDKVG